MNTRRMHMFRKSIIIATLVFAFASIAACGGATEDNGNGREPDETLATQEPTVEDGYLAEHAQDGMILHAWNWSMENIEAHLEDIAVAGYSTVQISPMQPQKDYFGIGTWEGNWWKLYQPLGFEIATGDHAIGTLSDLESLTDAADEYGIKVIVDVIANHLAEGDDETLHEDVEEYEPQIYSQSLFRTGYGYVNDNTVEAVTRGSLGGLPDLKTEHETVQERTLHLLKSYVDAGVDGFRFDAAKHIETPEDGDYASDFWPTVIDGIEDYADGDLFIYGEILNTAGSGRSYTDYTSYMGVTANTVSDDIRNSLRSGSIGSLENLDYPDDVAAEKSVLWPESHDDFAGGHTRTQSVSLMNKTYAAQASLKDATSLYFARPEAATLMGEVGTYDWKSLEVTESNRFNNYFIGASEEVTIHDGYFLNERFDEDREGAMLVNVDGPRRVEDMPVSNLSDGEYKDQVSNTTFTVEDGKLSGVMARSGIAAIYNNPYQPLPAVYVSDTGEGASFIDTKTVTVFAHNATDAYYTVDDGDPVEFSGQRDVELSHPDDNATITLRIVASYGERTVEETYTYEKSNVVVDEVTVNNLDTDVLEGKTLAAWAWPTGEDGQWVEGTLEDDSFTFDLPENHMWFLLVTFPEDTTEFDWDDAIEQTGDTQVPSDGVYDGSQMSWQ